MAVLTNGLSWWFYLPLSEGPWDERKFFAIDIQQQEIVKTAQYFRDFLSREATTSGCAIERAQKLQAGKEKDRVIRKTIYRAWKQLIEEPEELLVELLGEKVESLCGHRPGSDFLTGFLKARLITYPDPGGKQQMTERESSSGLEQEQWTHKKPSAYRFAGQRREVHSFTKLLLDFCGLLYERHPSDFDRVLSLRIGRAKCHFSRERNALRMGEPVKNSGIYVNTNLSGEDKRALCNGLLELFGYSHDDLQVEL